MALGAKRSDKQWRFVGRQVKDVKGLTMAHIRSVYGLGPNTHDSHRDLAGTPSIKESKDNIDTIFPYCGNRYVPSLAETETRKRQSHGTCSAARCKDGNPHCLNYMGQDQWEKEDAFDKYFSIHGDKPNPELNKRSENAPAGMKNLGATCYANSLLQVWFHDLAFRDSIYRCQFDEHSDKSMNALYQLQLLFAYLDRGSRNVYNPLSLVSSLKLDTTMQQDAQEFCNLFMARIDSQLQMQMEDPLRNFVKNQFQGHYTYNTTCKNCKKTSVRDCTFYELMLNITDNCTLMDCFEELVAPELLTGDDRQVLNIQLMRFVYDNITWTKKKSKDAIRFPQTIDFSGLLGSTNEALYDLSAVLVHSGPSAHSGHFSAHILDKKYERKDIRAQLSRLLMAKVPVHATHQFIRLRTHRSNKWFVLNDEEVSEFNDTKFDPEDYSELSAKAKTKRTVMKSNATEDEKRLSVFSSRNAYMLTYTKRTGQSPIEPCTVPVVAMTLVNKDNSIFEDELEEYKLFKERIKHDFERLRSERRDIYQSWHVNWDDDDSCYVSTEALAKYIRFDSHTASVQDGETAAAQKLLMCQEQESVDPTLTTNDICSTCTRNIFKDKLYLMNHRQDADEFDRKAKGIKSPPTAWISKAWLTEWLKISPRFHPVHGTTTDDPSPLTNPYISDVLCPHSNLSSDKLKRKLINKAKELSGVAMRGMRIRHMDPGIRHYAISQGFMRKWLNYIKKPTVKERPSTIDNTTLLCNHGQLLFDPDNVADAENEDGISVVKEEEWAYLQAIYGGGPEIVVTKTEVIQTDSDRDQSTVSVVTESVPGVCSTCRNERILDFESTTLIIRVHSTEQSAIDSADALTNHLHEPGSVAAVHSGNALGSSTPTTKRKQTPSTTSNELGMRRSKRSKAVKQTFKEIKIPVSKWDTVFDLKLKIMQKTDVVPLYQKLVYENTELDKNEVTIADLRIQPNAVLSLVAFDQSMDDLDLSNFQGTVAVKKVAPEHLALPYCRDSNTDDAFISLLDFAPTPGHEGGFGGTGLADEWP
ncbi:hypothetical protein BGZ50_006967 [Haplosporangium sp. Z 11]|nr:hypothetical protein BGZ50_006967 [Haplosporangium sp. Z 11]